MGQSRRSMDIFPIETAMDCMWRMDSPAEIGVFPSKSSESNKMLRGCKVCSRKTFPACLKKPSSKASSFLDVLANSPICSI